MKQIKDGKQSTDSYQFSKTQSQKIFTDAQQSSQVNSGKRSQVVIGKDSGNQRKMGLITTQLLNEGSGAKPTKSAISKNESQRESKLSLYTDKSLQYETKTEDGRRTVGQASAVMTDTKINLFSNQSIPNGPSYKK